VFAAAASPFIALILWLNGALYGGALKSGYGQLQNLFSLVNIPSNAVQYARWLVATQTPLPLLGLLAPFLVHRDRRPAVMLALGLIATTAVIYFAYTPFDDWSYLRFLMLPLVLLLVLAGVCVAALAARARGPVGVLMGGALTVAYAIFCVRAANDHFAFRMRALEQRYRSAGIVARDRLPADAAILTTWDSGAIRFHAGKEAIVWDALEPEWLDRATAWLSGHGHAPFILVESWEEPRFRQRFSGYSPLGNLDWPPKYEIDRVIRIYDPADRARYVSGEKVITEYLWPLRGVH
jgi:hypothetical protein